MAPSHQFLLLSDGDDLDAIYYTPLCHMGMHVCVVKSALCVISNKAVMDCGVLPFSVRWTESKYCTACSDTLFDSMSASLPLSQSYTSPAGKKGSSEIVIYLHLIRSFHYLFPLHTIRAGPKHHLNNTRLHTQAWHFRVVNPAITERLSLATPDK